MVGRSLALSPARKSLKRDGWFSRSWLKRNCGSSGLPSLGADSSAAVWSMKVADSSGKASGDGLEFYLAINGPHAGKSVTSSARYHHQAYTMDSINLGVYEQARFTLQTGNQQKELKLEKMEVIDPKKEPGFDNYFPYEVPSNGALTVRCTFSGYGRGEKEVMCYISYHIAKLGDGVTDGHWERQADDAENSRTYAVVARAARRSSHEPPKRSSTA